MLKKILSLIVITIIAISSIGFVSADKCELQLCSWGTKHKFTVTDIIKDATGKLLVNNTETVYASAFDNDGITELLKNYKKITYTLCKGDTMSLIINSKSYNCFTGYEKTGTTKGFSFVMDSKTTWVKAETNGDTAFNGGNLKIRMYNLYF